MKSKVLFLLTAAAAVMVLATGCGNQSGTTSSSSSGTSYSSGSSSQMGSPSSGTSSGVSSGNSSGISSGSGSNNRVDYDEAVNGSSSSGAPAPNSGSYSGSDVNSAPGSSGTVPENGTSGTSGAANSGSGTPQNGASQSGTPQNGTSQSGSSSGAANGTSGSSSGDTARRGTSGNVADPTPEGNFPDDPGMMIPESSSRASTMSFSGTAAGSSDYSQFSARGLDWGPGGPVDALNRSQGALVYNGRYGKYNAIFIGPEQKTVYMTFDEGYENGLSNTFLDILKQKQVKAMFFVTYDFVHRNPQLVQRMIAEGHIVGSHSWSHKNYSTLTPDEMKADLTKMHEYVKNNFNYDMKYFRFPSGNFSEQALAVVKDFGYRSIFWSFAYVDWNPDSQPQPDASFRRVMKALCPGNIYLFHAVSSTNAQILPAVIDAVRAAGYQWGDPDELGICLTVRPV